MARDPNAAAIYECADLFRQRCLVEGHSLIWPNAPRWTEEHVDELSASLNKLKSRSDQSLRTWGNDLATLSPRAMQFMLDIFAFYCLYPTTFPRKQTNLQGLISRQPLLGEPDPSTWQVLVEAFAHGIGPLKGAYIAHRPREFLYLIRVFEELRRQGVDPNDAHGTVAVAEQIWIESGMWPVTLLTTLHLLFPDEIEPIARWGDREHIIQAFAASDGPSSEFPKLARDRRSILDLDHELATIRAQMSNNGRDTSFSFYREDIRRLWDPELSPSRSEPRIIKIAPGHDAQVWPDCLHGGYICVAWDETGDLRNFASKDAFLKEFGEVYTLEYSGIKAKITEKANELWTLMELKPGDRIVANKGTSKILGIGTVVEPGYRWMPDRKDYRHTVAVEWDTSFAKEIPDETSWESKTVEDVSPDLWQLISGKLPEPPVNPPESDYIEPSFPEIVRRIAAAGLRIDERTLRRYHLALKTRGFVVLSGLSGTGKTWLAEVYAEAIGAQHLVVPVAPNWTTNEDLLGYTNPLDGTYHDTQFSRFLRAASAAWERSEEKAQPYHLVLDEMNLARVEYYFARFLSAMEMRARKGNARIELAPDEQVMLTPNLVVIGTVNIDETTHGFADKVLDRAQMIELEARRDHLALHVDGKPYASAILEIWDAVRHTGPFSYRVLDEIDAYLNTSEKLGVPWEEALDEQLLQKVLPKLRGGDPAVGEALQRFIDLSNGRFPLSHSRATTMYAGYQLHGFASYFH